MSRAMTDAFVRNLKLLNAKERDHLMRFAYLGQSTDYSTASTCLSSEFHELLRKHAVEMGLGASAKCVFAGMDYHLDWLFAAFWIARESPNWTSKDPIPDPVRMDPVPAPVRGGTGYTGNGAKALYTDFHPISGSQEDIDLLVVYDDGNKLAVLFIEAKGSAAFDRVQLARKLIRLDRILVESGMTSQDDRSLEFRLILAAPKKPSFKCCLEYAMELPQAKAGEDKFSAMRVALKEHSCGIGNGLHFLPIPGFPQETYAVERVPEAGAYAHWTLRKRK